jgi:hypothetical protein
MYYLISFFSFILLYGSSNNGIISFSEKKQEIHRVIHYGVLECGANKTTKGRLNQLDYYTNLISYSGTFPTTVPSAMEIKSFEMEISTPASKGSKKYTCSGSLIPLEVKEMLKNAKSGPITIIFKKVVILNAANKPKTLEGKFTFIFE